MNNSSSLELVLNDEIKKEQYLNNFECVKMIIEALPEIIAVLNEDNHIIFGNKALMNFLGLVSENELIGVQSEEFIKCDKSEITKKDSPKPRKCFYSGAMHAIKECQRILQKVTTECQVNAVVNGKNETLDLQVTSAPFLYEKKAFTILSIEDVSDSKHRFLLDKIFYHDIANIAGGLKGISDILLNSTDQRKAKEYIGMVSKMSNELLEEIMSQRALTFAKQGKPYRKFIRFSCIDILKETVSYLSHHTISNLKKIIVEKNISDLIISSDEILLKRVLINMLKNALEASNDGSEIILNYRKDGEFVIFTIHNDTYIPNKIQSKIFQSSFSTKGKGHGIGTYSIKVLTEQYLKGTVGFNTSKEKGTNFFIRIPLS